MRWLRLYRVHGLLGGLLLAMYTALAVRGFNLGLYGDVLAYIYHYETRGIRGGMNWLVTEHWHRHLAGALASAPIQVLFPGNDDVWYAIALAIHFLNALVFFAFLDYWMQGKLRPVLFAGALLFAFEILQIESHFIFATATHRKSALLMSIFSLWAYVYYVRTQRRHLLAYNASWALFMVAGAIYEQALFFFLLHPFLAVLEDWRKPVSQPRWCYGLRLLIEMLPYGFFILGYAYLIDVLFISSNVETTPAYILRQITGALNRIINPLIVVERISPAFQGGGLLLVMPLVVVVGVILYRLQPENSDNRGALLSLLLFGFGLALLNILGVSPTSFAIARAPRLIYPAALGMGLIFAVLLYWLGVVIPSKRIGRGVFAVGASMLIAAGVVRFFQLQTYYLERDAAREQVKAAVHEALPDWDVQTPPYLLVITDAHPSDELALYAQDINFPFMFDLMYGMEGILADAVYYDIDAPPETSGQHIIATEDGIISPLRPDLRIDPARLVVIAYDSTTDTAQVLERVPPEVVTAGNLHEEVPFDWETNDAYLN